MIELSSEEKDSTSGEWNADAMVEVGGVESLALLATSLPMHSELGGVASKKETSSCDTRRLEHFGAGFSVTGKSFSAQAAKAGVLIVSKNSSSERRRLSTAVVSGVRGCKGITGWLVGDRCKESTVNDCEDESIDSANMSGVTSSFDIVFAGGFVFSFMDGFTGGVIIFGRMIGDATKTAVFTSGEVRRGTLEDEILSTGLGAFMGSGGVLFT